MKITHNKKAINVEVKKVNTPGKFFGLMFQPRSTPNLLFEFNSTKAYSIHSFFVFFRFLAIWLDNRNRVLGSQIVKPFTPLVKPRKGAAKLVELPLNFKNEKTIQLLVGKRKHLNISRDKSSYKKRIKGGEKWVR